MTLQIVFLVIASMIAGAAIASAILLAAVGKRIKQESKPPESKLIRERRMKMLFNPFNEKYMWVILNPKTRIWEWDREATQYEIDEWREGQMIAAFGESVDNG